MLGSITPDLARRMTAEFENLMRDIRLFEGMPEVVKDEFIAQLERYLPVLAKVIRAEEEALKAQRKAAEQRTEAMINYGNLSTQIEGINRKYDAEIEKVRELFAGKAELETIIRESTGSARRRSVT